MTQLQPFELFKAHYIDVLFGVKKIWLVTQTFTRPRPSEKNKKTILITDYDDIGLAKIHLTAIRQDPLSSIINISNARHVSKLKQMLASDSQYDLYWNVVKNKQDLKAHLRHHYRDKIRTYVLQKTDWRIGGDEVLRTSLQAVFGELFIIIKRNGQTIRIKFEEIEAM